MVGITALWLPIVLGGVAVFITSSILHMVLPHHKSDHKNVPNEDAILAALRQQNIPPGDYSLPGMAHDKATRESDAFKAKLDQGPLLVMTIMPQGSFTDAMGKTLIKWFVFCVIVSLVVAYAAELALNPGDDYMKVFRFTGTVAFGFYALGGWPQNIWYRSSTSTAIKNTVDSFLYGLMTGGVFGWLWP